MELSHGLWSCAPRTWASEGGEKEGELEQKETTRNKVGEVVKASL